MIAGASSQFEAAFYLTSSSCSPLPVQEFQNDAKVLYMNEESSSFSHRHLRASLLTVSVIQNARPGGMTKAPEDLCGEMQNAQSTPVLEKIVLGNPRFVHDVTA